MSDTKNNGKKTLTLGGKKLGMKTPGNKDQVRQSFSHGRSKTVAVEVRKKRSTSAYDKQSGNSRGLTESELDVRKKVLAQAAKRKSEEDARRKAEEETLRKLAEERREVEAEKSAAEEAVKNSDNEKVATDANPQEESAETAVPKKRLNRPAKKAKEAPKPTISKVFRAVPVGKKSPVAPATPAKAAEPTEPKNTDTKKASKNVVYRARAADDTEVDDNKSKSKKSGKQDSKKSSGSRRDSGRRLNRSVIDRAMDDGGIDGRTRSLASIQRARRKEREKAAMENTASEPVKVFRDVDIPETISVQELANRMSERGADVVKTLMKMGMMVTINQVIDADTAELVCSEMGHRANRILNPDIELGLEDEVDAPETLRPRAPVVTIMGHVDHGKTSLLDALRLTDVVSGEAGGITQHIGAYQVKLESGSKITFIDTPGHAAFTEMRLRGANVTDIVVLVVAADDGLKEQTIEAINHAKAAKVPIIVAINKIDKPDSNPDNVMNELLQQELVVEKFGGEVLCVEVSAKEKRNLDKLEEAILLQSEMLNLQANPNRLAQGSVIEAKVDRGRGPVATILVERGTLRTGQIMVAGNQFGRVRAVIDDKGRKLQEAGPSVPVEILGLGGAPRAGDKMMIVDSEYKAREITEYRAQKDKEAKIAKSAKSAMEQMMSHIASGDVKTLPVVVKADVQGSLEAIRTSLEKIESKEVKVQVLHGAVGGINESDVALAQASGGVIIGFNVRANPQARELSRRDGVELRYYSIIYDVMDDIKALMSGLLAPTLQEKFLGYAEIREVFSVSRVGKIAGCYVTEGIVKRGSKVRLLRENVVIHEGNLKTLKRFKEEVKEVRENYECGMSFESYNDIKVGDVIECFEMQEITRKIN